MIFRVTKKDPESAQENKIEEKCEKQPEQQPDESVHAPECDIISDMQVYSQSTDAALLEKCNNSTRQFGLVLTEKALQQLQRQRVSILKSTGRVEFGDGVLLKLIQAFRASPYLDETSYAQTLGELQETFYTFKNECRELLTDDELIEAMRLIFDEVSRGSVEYISTVEWDTMYRIGRTGSLHGTDLEYPYPGEGFADDDEQW